MRLKRLVSGMLIVATSLGMLTGCSQDMNYSEVSNAIALGGESSINSLAYQLSYTEQQELVYAQVSNKTLLDLAYFNKCTPDVKQQVISYMDTLDNVLTGQIKNSNRDSLLEYLETWDEKQIMKQDYANYISFLFAQSPYYWQRSSMNIIGESTQTGYVVCDVVYETINYKKEIMTPSTIANGSPLYSKLTENRYNSWCEILELCLDTGTTIAQIEMYANTGAAPENEDVAEAVRLFKLWTKSYGDYKVVYEEQKRYGFDRIDLIDYLYNSKNQVGYTGLIDHEAEQSGAQMTVRYILQPNIVLGINQGYTCTNVYLTDYKLDDDITKDKSIFTAEGYATITDAVYELMYSYFKCIDEANHTGLYSLMQNYADIDKYYQDYFDYTINKHNSFSVSLFDITGTHITCGISVSSKQRPRGTKMTSPIYTDRYYVEIDLVGNKLKIANITLLSRKLEGEPNINAIKQDESGFSQKITLSDNDKKQIEAQINNFSMYQLQANDMGTGLEEILDYSISNSNMTSLKTNMLSLKGDKKLVFLQSYIQGANGYALVKCRELFQQGEEPITEAIVQYELMLKGNKWYIVDYNVLSSFKSTSTQLHVTGYMSLVTPEKVEAYNSQVNTNTKPDKENNTNIETIDYSNYNPITKQPINTLHKDEIGSDDKKEDLDEVTKPDVPEVPSEEQESTEVPEGTTVSNTEEGVTENLGSVETEPTTPTPPSDESTESKPDILPGT